MTVSTRLLGSTKAFELSRKTKKNQNLKPGTDNTISNVLGVKFEATNREMNF